MEFLVACRHPLSAIVYYDSVGLHEGGDPWDPLQRDISVQHVSGIDLEKQVVCRGVHFSEVPSATPLDEGRSNRRGDGAPLDLMSAVWNRQHDATRLPPDDLLACVGERDADEGPALGSR